MKIASKYFKNSVALVVSLLFVAWFTHLISQQNFDFLTPLLNLPTWLVWFVFLGLPTTYLLRGWRVAYEFRDYPGLSLSKSIQIVLWHNASVNLLPFRSGEAAFPILLHRIAHVPLIHSISSLTHLRMQDACIVLLMGVAFWPNLEGSTRFLLLCLILVFLVGIYRWFKKPSDWQDSTFFVKKYIGSFRHAMATGNPNALQSWLLTLCNWLIKISLQAALYCELAKIDFSTGVLATVSSEVAAFSPLQGIAGIGTFEVSGATAMYTDGVPWVTGIQVAAMVHLIMLSSSVLWAFVVYLPTQLNLTINKAP
jgi:hypothetical protein